LEWTPVLTRAGVRVSAVRVAQAYLELAVLVRALEGLAAAARVDAAPDRSSLWAGLFDLRENLIERAVEDLRALAAELTVVGSINLDLVARVERLPRSGETVSGAELARVPGGKGANQAVAATRLGARVTLRGAV